MCKSKKLCAFFIHFESCSKNPYLWLPMNQGHIPSRESVFRQAEAYRRQGDVYMALKLHKKLAREEPGWGEPLEALCKIYVSIRDWKAALHYSERAIHCAEEPRSDVLRCQGIAATALRRWRIARQAWNQLGFNFRETDEELKLDMGAVCLRWKLDAKRQAVLWARLIDPARAEVLSVPTPGCGVNFRDILLIDSAPIGYRVAGKKRIPVYEALEPLKRNHYYSLELWLPDAGTKELDILASLCKASGLGFDHWSGASWQLRGASAGSAAEYHHYSGESEPDSGPCQIGLAARHPDQARKLLRQWELITLGDWLLLAP
jgi:tetratricopeptide (TPR) repeat protein